MRDYFQVDKYIQQLEEATDITKCERVPVPDIEENQNYLFISYAHQDYKKVYADLAVLYHAGVRFWYDQGLKAGKNWDTEVFEMIKNPRCSGVIFFLSENLFLSKSANQEIDVVMGSENVPFKNYFCVNLTEVQPNRILRNILRLEDSVLDNAGLDMDRIATLAKAFSDKQTYLSIFDVEHKKNLLHQIASQFDVTEAAIGKRGYLINKATDERIQITEDSFAVGKEQRKCHYCIENDSAVSRWHMCIKSDGRENAVMDMGAANGTYLNGQRIASMVFVPLQDGDEITIGRQVLVFHTN